MLRPFLPRLHEIHNNVGLVYTFAHAHCDLYCPRIFIGQSTTVLEVLFAFMHQTDNCQQLPTFRMEVCKLYTKLETKRFSSWLLRKNSAADDNQKVTGSIPCQWPRIFSWIVNLRNAFFLAGSQQSFVGKKIFGTCCVQWFLYHT